MNVNQLANVREQSHARQDKRGRLIRIGEVEHLTGLRKTTIYKMMGNGLFVRSVRLSARAVAWREYEVLAWCEARVAAGGAR